MTDALKMTSDTGIYDFVGIEPVGHILLGGVGNVDEAAHAAMLEEVKQTIQAAF
ncbi:hypothetical protein D1872_352880 [compost metagenome]